MDHGPTALPVRADFDPQATDQELLEQVIAFYHQRLKNTLPPASSFRVAVSLTRS